MILIHTQSALHYLYAFSHLRQHLHLPRSPQSDIFIRHPHRMPSTSMTQPACMLASWLHPGARRGALGLISSSTRLTHGPITDTKHLFAVALPRTRPRPRTCPQLSPTPGTPALLVRRSQQRDVATSVQRPARAPSALSLPPEPQASTRLHHKTQGMTAGDDDRGRQPWVTAEADA